jgi:Ca2+-binding EF-hand superfamily protein
MRMHLAGIVAAVVFTAGPLAAQDAADLFNKLDANKDGYITPDEVQEAQKALYERMLRNADKNGDKKLSKEEFLAGLKPDEGPKTPLPGGQAFGAPGGKAKGDPRQFFDRLDANKDGKLGKEELPEQMRERFAGMDANGDGFITPEEFARGAMAFGKRPPGAPPAPPEGNAAQRQTFETLFDRTDSNSDGKLTKDEIPEERQIMRAVLERSGGDSIGKEQFVRAMMAAMAQGDVQRTRRSDGAPARPDGTPPRSEGAPPRRPEGAPGAPPPGGGLFGTLDTDHNGELSTAEIVAAGSTLLKLDRNGDGKLTPDEVFGGQAGGRPPGRPGERRPGEGRPGAGQPGNSPPAAGAPNAERRPGQRGRGGLNPEELREQLKRADANGDGKLSKDEVPEFMKERFDRIDTNSDGFIDEAEMREMLRRMADGGGKGQPRPGNDNK